MQIIGDKMNILGSTNIFSYNSEPERTSFVVKCEMEVLITKRQKELLNLTSFSVVLYLMDLIPRHLLFS